MRFHRASALLSLLSTGFFGCSDRDAEPTFTRPREERARSSPSAVAPIPTTVTPEDPSPVADVPAEEPGVLPPAGRWYTLSLPAGASRTVSSAPEVVDATYVLDAAEGLHFAVFRPMPAQDDLEAWTTATEGILEGLPRRHDDARVDGVPARLATFDDQLRWTFVADGMGGLLRCFADGPRDEAWLRERCEPVVASLRLSRPMRP
ncbi:MAG: hypothetical protein OHK0013_36180 [Sandaracinaceae bacterium]